MNTLNTNIHLGSFIGPLIFFVLGLYFHRKGNRLLSGIFFLISLIAFFDHVLHINIVGVIIASIFIYFGYRLMSGEKEKPKEETSPYHEQPHSNHETVIEKKENPDEHKFGDTHFDKKIFTSPTFRSSLIGDLHLLSRFELKDMTIRNAIGDIKIDLSKAIIPDGETVIVVNGWIGDIDIYIPDDLDISIQAMVSLGELDIFDNNQSGFNRSISVTTKDFKDAPKRVKIVLALFIGDIDVRYV